MLVYVTGVSVRDAAATLGVSSSRVRALAASGRLPARRLGSQWLIDANAVARRAESSSGMRGRSMSRRTAWAAAALLDGHSTDWLATSERARLRTRLGSYEANAVDIYRHWFGSRAATKRYRIAATDVDELLAERDVVRGGISAAEYYDVGLSNSGEAEIYVSGQTAERLIRSFFLTKSDQGNLLMHVLDGEEWHLRTAIVDQGKRVVPSAIVAVDLLDRDDSRSRDAGQRLLAEALEQGLQVRASHRHAS